MILFVGDGMGISNVTAARILEGRRKGGSGEDNLHERVAKANGCIRHIRVPHPVGAT